MRLFYWPWWIESIDFLAEEIVLLLCYLLWVKMSASRRGKTGHLGLGVVYLVMAWISAVPVTTENSDQWIAIAQRGRPSCAGGWCSTSFRFVSYRPSPARMS